MIHFHFDLHTVREFKNLSLWRRLMHRKTQRHLLGVTLGVCLMLTGSNMALHHWEAINHVIWDCVAYGVHAVGTVPILKHVEPIWAIITLEMEN